MPNAFEKYANSILGSLPTIDQEPLDFSDGEYNEQDQAESIWQRFNEIHASYLLDAGSNLTSAIITTRLHGLPGVEGKKILDGGIVEYGFECLAFYKSYRLKSSPPFSGKWGIFVFGYSINMIADEIQRDYPAIANPFHLAYRFLHRHEQFHFHLDAWLMAVEALQKRHLYLPYHQHYRNNPSARIEEALANRNAFVKTKRWIEDYAFNFMKCQPGCYARFDEDVVQLRAELGANLIDGNYSGGQRFDQVPWIAHGRQELINDRLCPSFIITRIPPSQIISPALTFPSINAITETKDFTKSIGRYGKELEAKWGKVKTLLCEHPELRGLNFKPWKKPIWSLRVDDNFRAHLRPLHQSPNTWEAIEFGSHKAMGHG